MYSNWDCCYSKLVNTVMQQPDEAMVQYPYEVTDTYSLIITFQQNLPTTPRRERELHTLAYKTSSVRLFNSSQER